MEFEKRIEICALLHADLPPKRIAELVGCSHLTVFVVRRAVKAGENLERQQNSPLRDKLIDDFFLAVLVLDIAEDPTHSMSNLARNAGVSECTIHHAVATIRLKSYVQRVRHMLTLTTMENWVIWSKKLLN